jgi:hypothetical protein
MCTITPEPEPERRSEALPPPTQQPAPGPLLLLGQHIRIVQSGFGSLAEWLALLGEGCCRLLRPTVRQRSLA